MRLVTVKGRELAPSAATKAGAGGGHEFALAGASGEGRDEGAQPMSWLRRHHHEDHNQ
jgi:hypothetical protein